MRVLSCFDGISCGQVALERANFKPSVYFASEIDKHAIAVTQSNYPKTVQLGCVKNIVNLANSGALGSIDLLIGGSPCQGFSRAGLNLGFDDPRSKLLFDFVHIKSVLKPKYWLLENVRMSNEDMNFISILMGRRPVMIDSALFSAQRRKRLYWTNIPIAPIVDRNVVLKDIINIQTPFNIYRKKSPHVSKKDNTKSGTLTGAGGNSMGNHSEMELIVPFGEIIYTSKKGYIDQFANPNIRRYSVNECEKLQTLPVAYCNSISKGEAYRCLANGWTVDVIAHIMRGML